MKKKKIVGPFDLTSCYSSCLPGNVDMASSITGKDMGPSNQLALPDDYK
jgi:hypothetical protein